MIPLTPPTLTRATRSRAGSSISGLAGLDEAMCDGVWREAFDVSLAPNLAPMTAANSLELADWRARAEPGVHRASALAPGTCGELVQGVIGGRDFLITCPVNLFSRVEVVLTQSPECTGTGDRPLSKTATAVERFLRAHGYEGGARIRAESALAASKGLASSSADIAAGIHAAAEALCADVSAPEVGRFATSVEPTDAVFYPGIVIYDHIRGELLEPLGSPPPIQLYIVDGGDTLDTLAFDRDRHRRVARRHEALVERAVNLVRQGLRCKSPRLIGMGATLSARYHQEVRENPLVEPMLDVCQRVGGVGVNVAHSGTVVGLMLDRRSCNHDEVMAAVTETFGAGKLLGVCSLIGGGSRLYDVPQMSLSAAQRSVVNVLGTPKRRVRVPDGFALEFDHPHCEGQSIFACPDGQLLTESPDPSQWMAPVHTWRRPSPGECWEMRVVVVDRTDDNVRYLAVPTEPVKPGITRRLPPEIFDASFDVGGQYATRRIEVLSCQTGEVTYKSVVAGRAAELEVRTLPLPIFLANYRLGRAYVGDLTS